jgi:hypothetical protein
MIIAAIICAVSAAIAAIWMPHREKWASSDAQLSTEAPPQI